MQAIRPYFEDASAVVVIPKFMRHQRLVLTMQMQELPMAPFQAGAITQGVCFVMRKIIVWSHDSA
ncbi:MAG: hypothetical protein FD135_4119 [Comamonadaceae bacterium]|nr:MAG: hypothetical protein FD135_4119 [Comamonadaceae bacterium]